MQRGDNALPSIGSGSSLESIQLAKSVMTNIVSYPILCSFTSVIHRIER